MCGNAGTRKRIYRTSTGTTLPSRPASTHRSRLHLGIWKVWPHLFTSRPKTCRRVNWMILMSISTWMNRRIMPPLPMLVGRLVLESTSIRILCRDLCLWVMGPWISTEWRCERACSRLGSPTFLGWICLEKRITGQIQRCNQSISNIH